MCITLKLSGNPSNCSELTARNIFFFGERVNLSLLLLRLSDLWHCEKTDEILVSFSIVLNFPSICLLGALCLVGLFPWFYIGGQLEAVLRRHCGGSGKASRWLRKAPKLGSCVELCLA